MTVRAAVIGVGYLGTLHAEKYASLDGVDLVAVVDLDAEKAGALAARLGTRVEGGHEALLGEVDCVTIATPTPVHFETAKVFLEAGVDVLVEKPITAPPPAGRAGRAGRRARPAARSSPRPAPSASPRHDAPATRTTGCPCGHAPG